MCFSRTLPVLLIMFCIMSCTHKVEETSTGQTYFDIEISDDMPVLYAVTDQEYLEYGSNVAYINSKSDTIIPFGKYAYFGTDSFQYYFNALEHPNDSTYGKSVGVSHDQKLLFDLVMYDNGPEPFNEGLTRVLRDDKMGYANEKGQIVIPCIYDYAQWFHNGKAEVTFKATKYWDDHDHFIVESDEWIIIDKKGYEVQLP